jgi:hypothetical protein
MARGFTKEELFFKKNLISNPTSMISIEIYFHLYIFTF